MVDDWGKFIDDSSPTQVTRTSFQKEKIDPPKEKASPKEFGSPSPMVNFTDDELFTEFAPKKTGDGFLTFAILIVVMTFILYSALYFLKFFQIYDFSKTIGVSIFSPVDTLFGLEKQGDQVDMVALTEKDIDQIRQKFPEKPTIVPPESPVGEIQGSTQPTPQVPEATTAPSPEQQRLEPGSVIPQPSASPEKAPIEPEKPEQAVAKARLWSAAHAAGCRRGCAADGFCEYPRPCFPLPFLVPVRAGGARGGNFVDLPPPRGNRVSPTRRNHRAGSA